MQETQGDLKQPDLQKKPHLQKPEMEKVNLQKLALLKTSGPLKKLNSQKPTQRKLHHRPTATALTTNKHQWSVLRATADSLEVSSSQLTLLPVNKLHSSLYASNSSNSSVSNTDASGHGTSLTPGEVSNNKDPSQVLDEPPGPGNVRNLPPETGEINLYANITQGKKQSLIPDVNSNTTETPGQGAPQATDDAPSKRHHRTATKYGRHHGRTPTSPQSTLPGSLSDFGSSWPHISHANPPDYGTPSESDRQQSIYGTGHLGSILPLNLNQATWPKQQSHPPRKHPRSQQLNLLIHPMLS